MMALVAYDYSSESDNEEEDSSTASAVIIPNNKRNGVSVESSINNGETNEDADVEISTSDTHNSIGELLSNLPSSSKSEETNEIIEDKLEDFIPKYKPTEVKEKPPTKVKITIPFLSEFKDEDDDEPAPKKMKSSSKGSGLLSILPPIKGTPLTTKSFVPNVLKNKPDAQKSNSLVPHAVRKKAELAKKATLNKIMKSGNDLESDDDDDIELPETFDEEMWKKVCGRPKQKEVIQQQIDPPTTMTPVIDIAPEPVKPYEGLDNQAFKELVGKTKRPLNIKLVDLNEEEILPDKDVWLTKSLTDPDTAPKPEVDEVDPTRKKKHHITYLAQQAKANEQELQSQWSASKYTRNQTRAKYGF